MSAQPQPDVGTDVTFGKVETDPNGKGKTSKRFTVYSNGRKIGYVSKLSRYRNWECDLKVYNFLKVKTLGTFETVPSVKFYIKKVTETNPKGGEQ